MNDDRSFLSELKRRKVYRTAVAYVAATLALWGAVEVASGAFAWSGRVLRTVIVLSVVGLPLALLAAWVFEVRLEGSPVGGGVPRSKAVAVGSAAGIVAFLVLGATLANTIDPERVGDALLDDSGGTYRLAVLYFEDRTPERSFGHVADALTEELIEELARAGLDVVSKSGTEPFRGLRLPPDSVARLLGVAGLVEGWVEQDGSRVVVGTRLVDGRDGASLLSDTYATNVAEVTEVRDQVVVGVGRMVRRGIGRNVRLQAQRSAAPSTDAWLGVARADRWMKEAWEARDEGDAGGLAEALDAADAELRDVQAIAPNWSEPLTRRAWVAHERYALVASEEEFLTSMREAARLATEALGVDPEDGEAHEARATATYRRWLMRLPEDEPVRDSLLRSARADLERTIALDSLDATANSTLSHLLLGTGETEGARLAARRSYDNDAFLESRVGDSVLQRLYTASYNVNAHDDAALACRDGRQSFPRDYRFVECAIWVMTMPAATPDVDRAWEALAELRPLLPEGALGAIVEARARIAIGGVVGRAGLADSARAVFAAARGGAPADPGGELHGLEAAMRSVMGDVEGSLAVLEAYLAAHPDHPVTDHWWWSNLEGHPDFERLRAGN